MRRVIRCNACFHLWRTNAKLGSVVTCPMCGATCRVEIDPYLMEREEKRYRRSVKISLTIFFATICLTFWTLSLPADLITYVARLFFSGAVLYHGIIALSDGFRANSIRQELDQLNSAQFRRVRSK